MEPDILGYSINDTCKVIACGRTKTYQLIADGRLEAKKLGTKTIITRRSVERLFEELPDFGLAKPLKDKPATLATARAAQAAPLVQAAEAAAGEAAR